MTTSTSAIYVYTDRGQHHIFQLVGGTDGTLTAMTDLITGAGLESLAGQRIMKVMTMIENKVGQGNGILVVDPQNVPIASFPACRPEDQTPKWQMVNVGPIDLNWAMKINTLA